MSDQAKSDQAKSDQAKDSQTRFDRTGSTDQYSSTPHAESVGPIPEPGRQSSVPHLLRQLVDDVALLIRKELALATSEVTHSVDDAKQGAVSLASGGGVLYAGLLFLLLSATLGLAEVMPGWLAALIVGGVVAIIGLVMVQSGRKRMQASNFAPHRAAESVRRDKDMITRQTHEQHH